MEEKMVELTRFTKVSEAEILANLLQSEGIDCYVRNGFIHQIYSVDLGGVIVELLEKDRERAQEIMKDCGYTPSDGSADTQIPELTDDSDDSAALDEWPDSEDSEGEAAAYEQKKAKLSRNMTVITVLIILLVAVIILLNKYYNG